MTEAKLAWTTEPPAQLNEIFGKDWQKKFSQAVDQAAREMGSMEVFLDFCFPEWEPVRDEKNILYLKRCQWSKDLERRISTMKARNTEEKRKSKAKAVARMKREEAVERRGRNHPTWIR